MRRGAALSLLIVYSSAFSSPPAPIRGFAERDAAAQHAREQEFRALLDSARMRGYMEKMAAEPHHAGSPGSKRVAEYALGLFRSWGLDADIEEFDALLPYPTERSLELIGPAPYRARLAEPPLAEDPDSSDANQLPTYNAYSASGDVTAEFVYVNYGVPGDYAALAKAGVEVKGKIALARYGKSWRGTKAKTAQEHGAAACVIYSDPRDDGYFQGAAYPKGAWRPPAGVQRGSVMDMPLYVGDPLTPGWASEKRSKRLARADAETLMKIPVLPISYEDAQHILASLGGPLAREDWRGALPVTYRLGPGPSKARLRVDFDWSSKPLYNVIARIRGSENPEEWVIYGNHHDAWVNGAHDPVSGAVAVLEAARAMSEMRKKGWRPKRTIVFALWDAEEFGLIGSTEWAEKHAAFLKRNAVAYFNSDTNGNGKLAAGGTPSLQEFFAEVLRDAEHPDGKGALLPEKFQLTPLGAGSDYVAFVHHLGLPGLNAGYANREGGGIYHSIYDTVAWYRQYSDGDLRYGKSLAGVMGSALLRLADARLLPHDFLSGVSAIREYAADLGDVSVLETALEQLGIAASRYEQQVRSRRWERAAESKLKAVNALLRTAEQSLLVEAGLPGRPWYKHPVAAPGTYTGYSAKTLPAVREAIEAGRRPEAAAALDALAAAVRRLESRVAEASRLLAALPE